jgi:predicted cation transporter
MTLSLIGLFIILLGVLVFPFTIKIVEKQLEIFLLASGVIAVTITAQWHGKLVVDGLVEPIKITLAVFISGILFRFFQNRIAGFVKTWVNALGIKVFVLVMVIGLGILSSVITAIIAALLLVEIISHLKFDRKSEIAMVVFSCFSIGLGAVLTPVGEPLATLAISKLSGEPFHAGFWFLTGNLWIFILPAVLISGVTALFFIPNVHIVKHGPAEDRRESYKDIMVRTVKVYFFIMALIFLGQGFKPIIDTYISHMPVAVLYWINSISAILDNATLTAAEIGPSMSLMQINSALLGLLIAGGMLIPGNIPNIISAGKLKIGSGEWARIGLPAGLIMMLIYFPVILLLKSMIK